jgi:uncharacterized membrane protein YbaN (DUF454 family)
MLRLVCGVLWVQLGLVGLFFSPQTINSHQYVTHILTPLFERLFIMKDPMPFFSKTVQTILRMKSVVFWVITRRCAVIIYRRFGTTYRSHLHGSRFQDSYLESWPVKMGPIRCPETSVNNYHTTPCNNPEDQRFHQHRGGSLKSKFYACLKSVFRDRILTRDCGLLVHQIWTCVINSHLWDMLKDNNVHAEDQKESIQDVVSWTSLTKLQCSINVFVRQMWCTSMNPRKPFPASLT